MGQLRLASSFFLSQASSDLLDLLSPSTGLNECQLNNGGCSHVCVDRPIGFECQCSAGYKLLDKRTCGGESCLTDAYCAEFYVAQTLEHCITLSLVINSRLCCLAKIQAPLIVLLTSAILLFCDKCFISELQMFLSDTPTNLFSFPSSSGQTSMSVRIRMPVARSVSTSKGISSASVTWATRWTLSARPAKPKVRMRRARAVLVACCHADRSHGCHQ